MSKVEGDNVMPSGNSQSEVPMDEIKLMDFFSSSDGIVVSKSKSKSKFGNPSSYKNVKNSKDLPNGNLKRAVCPPLKKYYN